MTLLTNKFMVEERMDEMGFLEAGRYSDFSRYDTLRFSEEEVLNIINTFMNNENVLKVIVSGDRMGLRLKIGDNELNMGCIAYRNTNIKEILH